MDKFTMSAFARYAGKAREDAFAEVSEGSLVACFELMAAEVEVWLARVVEPKQGGGAPDAIELTLEWSGAEAPVPAASEQLGPSDSTACRPTPSRRSLLSCRGRRRGAREWQAVISTQPASGRESCCGQRSGIGSIRISVPAIATASP
jgi:hypothetical protein